MKEKQIRVLQVIRDFKKGGVQAEVMWPARLMSSDDVHFDVLLLSSNKGYYEEEFIKYGQIYRIAPASGKSKISRGIKLFTDPIFIYRELSRMLRSLPHYDAVHCHDNSYHAPVLLAAKHNGVKVRIGHSSVNKPEGKNKEILFVRIYLWICSRVLKCVATSKLGVTQNAADYIFGKGKGRVIKNPTIDLEAFDPKLYKRENKDLLTLIMVGSISPRKNQKFAVDVLYELKKQRTNCKLKIIGYARSEKEGYLPMLMERIEKLGLQNDVEFLPQDANIPYHMSQSDFLLMPSLQEGLPNVALEAQAMWLPCVISTDVAADCDCGLCTYLPLDAGAKAWSDYLLKEFDGSERKELDMSEWDNRKVCQEYLELWRGNIS